MVRRAAQRRRRVDARRHRRAARRAAPRQPAGRAPARRHRRARARRARRRRCASPAGAPTRASSIPGGCCGSRPSPASRSCSSTTGDGSRWSRRAADGRPRSPPSCSTSLGLDAAHRRRPPRCSTSWPSTIPRAVEHLLGVGPPAARRGRRPRRLRPRPSCASSPPTSAPRRRRERRLPPRRRQLAGRPPPRPARPAVRPRRRPPRPPRAARRRRRRRSPTPARAGRAAGRRAGAPRRRLRGAPDQLPAGPRARRAGPPGPARRAAARGRARSVSPSARRARPTTGSSTSPAATATVCWPGSPRTLTAAGCDIAAATVATWPDGAVVDTFLVRSAVRPRPGRWPSRWRQALGQRARRRAGDRPRRVRSTTTPLPWHTACTVTGTRPARARSPRWPPRSPSAGVVVHSARVDDASTASSSTASRSATGSAASSTTTRSPGVVARPRRRLPRRSRCPVAALTRAPTRKNATESKHCRAPPRKR